MDFSIAEGALWSSLVQVGIISIVVLVANVIRRKVGFFRNSLLPTAVLAGFILFGLKLSGLVKIDTNFFEAITYHGIAIGFIALSLRVPPKKMTSDKGVGIKSGALIVSSYLIQGLIGLIISIGLAYTIAPNLFKAAGILLPMGYGQGPGQANNIGSTYEALGFAGGRSFALAIAAAGYLSACLVGVIYLTVLEKRNKLVRSELGRDTNQLTVDDFQAEDEIPISESVDKLSVQVAIVILVYMFTFFFTVFVTSLLTAYAPSVGELLNSLLWGFNFMIGAGFAILTRLFIRMLRKMKIMKRQYQSNFLLSRISGLAFDVMIVAGIASINLEDLKGLWLPFILMTVLGAAATLLHISIASKRVYKDYRYEGLISMYGMMTGTISSGVLLLREVDPQLKTPAANNLVVGSSFAILLAIPMLVFVGLAPKSTVMLFGVVGAIVIYLVILLFIIYGYHPKIKEEKK
jgi:ESS family glutamate:Na+ symporter